LPVVTANPAAASARPASAMSARRIPGTA